MISYLNQHQVKCENIYLFMDSRQQGNIFFLLKIKRQIISLFIFSKANSMINDLLINDGTK